MSAHETIEVPRRGARHAQKTIQFVPHYETGPSMNARARAALTLKPETRNFVLQYLKGGKS